MIRVVCNLFATIAAVERTTRTYALASRALSTVRARSRAIPAVLFVRPRVEASIRAHDVKLGVEQVWIANAFAIFTERVGSALGVTVAAVVLVVFDVDTATAAVQRAWGALAGSVDAAARTTTKAVRTRVTQKPAARVAIAGAAAALVRDTAGAERACGATRSPVTARRGARGDVGAGRAPAVRRTPGTRGRACSARGARAARGRRPVASSIARAAAASVGPAASSASIAATCVPAAAATRGPTARSCSRVVPATRAVTPSAAGRPHEGREREDPPVAQDRHPPRITRLQSGLHSWSEFSTSVRRHTHRPPRCRSRMM